MHSRFIRCISYFMCCFHWISTHFDVNTVNSIGESSNNFVFFFFWTNKYSWKMVGEFNQRWKIHIQHKPGEKTSGFRMYQTNIQILICMRMSMSLVFPNMLIYSTKVVHGFLCRREDFFSNLWIRFVHHSHFFPPLKNMCRFSICAVFILDCRRLFIYFSLRNEKMSLTKDKYLKSLSPSTGKNLRKSSKYQWFFNFHA